MCSSVFLVCRSLVAWIIGSSFSTISLHFGICCSLALFVFHVVLKKIYFMSWFVLFICRKRYGRKKDVVITVQLEVPNNQSIALLIHTGKETYHCSREERLNLICMALFQWHRSFRRRRLFREQEQMK